MFINLFPALAYALISTFTPGPSNISTVSVAVMHGYKNSLTYQAGLAVGVFLIMFISGLITTTLLGIFPMLEQVMRLVGAAYILYLAYTLLRATYAFNDQPVRAAGFVSGFLLQVLNPKLMVYAFTLFSSFLAPLTNSVALLFAATLVLTAIAFCSTNLWAAFGNAVKVFLREPRQRAVVNIILALSLVYTAIALTGII
jgi:cysteine/O-acetylserine efflux protein